MIGYTWRKWRSGCTKRELEVWDAEYGAGIQVVESVYGGDKGREADMEKDEEHDGNEGLVVAVLKHSLLNYSNTFAVNITYNSSRVVTESSDSDAESPNSHDRNDQVVGYYFSCDIQQRMGSAVYITPFGYYVFRSRAPGIV